MNAIVRKELHLDPEVLACLQALADRKQWSVKKYMEHVLINDSKKALRLKDNKDELR